MRYKILLHNCENMQVKMYNKIFGLSLQLSFQYYISCLDDFLYPNLESNSDMIMGLIKNMIYVIMFVNPLKSNKNDHTVTMADFEFLSISLLSS